MYISTNEPIISFGNTGLRCNAVTGVFHAEGSSGPSLRKVIKPFQDYCGREEDARIPLPFGGNTAARQH